MMKDAKWHIVNVEGVMYKDGKILMGKRSSHEDHAPGTYAFIGGKVEEQDASYEILEQTLKREIMEEVDCSVTNLQYVTSSSFVADTGEHVVDVVFRCDWESGKPKPVDPNETEDVVWMTKEEILTHPKVDEWTKHVITLLQ